MSVIVNNSLQVIWHETVKEAECRCSISLEDNLEKYLVSLLTRYTDKPDLVKSLFSSALLQAFEKAEAERDVLLQRVGDECLLYSGLFPRVAQKKNVNLRYFVDIGRSAYGNMSDRASHFFEKLAIEFVPLMDVLQSIRPQPDLLPLEAYEQWMEVGSQRARRILESYRQCRT